MHAYDITFVGINVHGICLCLISKNFYILEMILFLIASIITIMVYEAWWILLKISACRSWSKSELF